jgi:3-deoxy-D-manno-octulosonate 8-phosphate phosphatase (KDO 8-P phosphatase)
MTHTNISIDSIEAFIFDFDGVLTNNSVFVSEDGTESVVCSRSDGLAFDILKKLQKPTYILSTEKNLVVSSRAKKLQVSVLQGIENKSTSLKELAIKEGYSLQNILYVGNDLNDYHAMKLCGYTFCPSDSHEQIKLLAKNVLSAKGGNGVVREILEEFLKVDFIKVLYSN